MKTYKHRLACEQDHDMLLRLYLAVAGNEGGIARSRLEIDDNYISTIIKESMQRGIIFVVSDDTGKKIIAEIHGYRPGIKVFNHVFSDFTIVVDPEYQGCGIGKYIFNVFLSEVKNNHPDILRVELIVRESNQKAIEFYKKIGFEIEGRLEKRIFNQFGKYEADIPMAWFNPSFKK